MVFTNLPIKELSLEAARAGGLSLTAAYFTANGVAAANNVTFWVAPSGTYSSTGGTGVANYSPTGVTPNSDLLPAQPPGFAGTYGNGPVTTASAPNLTAMRKPLGPLFIFLYNTSGVNAITLKPLAGSNPPASQASQVSKVVATVCTGAATLSVLGPFTSAELAQADGTFQFLCTGTTPAGWLLAVRADLRAS